jgi:hypothetical protein
MLKSALVLFVVIAGGSSLAVLVVWLLARYDNLSFGIFVPVAVAAWIGLVILSRQMGWLPPRRRH